MSISVHRPAHDPALSEQDIAILAREAWMRQMGLSEEEIREYCDVERHPAVLKEELESLVAMLRIQAAQ